MNHPQAGVVHGRFQLLHLGHLKYILAAKARCDFLYIGITSPKGPFTEEQAARWGARPKDNPFTYDERKDMIEAALTEAGVAENEYAIIPFPSDYQDIPEYLTGATFFLTIYDDLGHEKQTTLQSRGFNVDVLMTLTKEERGESGGTIRAKLRKDDPSWEQAVPTSVVRYIETHGLRARLKSDSRK